jgi:hypothetical protein
MHKRERRIPQQIHDRNKQNIVTKKSKPQNFAHIVATINNFSNIKLLTTWLKTR